MVLDRDGESKRERNESQREIQTERPRETISFALIQFLIKIYRNNSLRSMGFTLHHEFRNSNWARESALLS